MRKQIQLDSGYTVLRRIESKGRGNTKGRERRGRGYRMKRKRRKRTKKKIKTINKYV